VTRWAEILRYAPSRAVLAKAPCANMLVDVVVGVSLIHREKRRPEVFGRGMALLWLLATEPAVREVSFAVTCIHT
jgi:hypothetical protein